MATLEQYRLGFASEVPFVADVIQTGAQDDPPDGAYVGTPNGADARRIIASSDLADMARSSSLQDTSSDFYQGAYAYVPSLVEQRRIADRGYEDSVDATDLLDDGGTVQVGACTVTRQYAAALPPGIAIELHPLLPPARNVDRLPSIHTLINRALRSMRWVRRIDFTGNGGDAYSLAAYPEITRDSQVQAAYYAATDATVEPSTLYGGATLRWNGETAYLTTGQRQSSSQGFSIDMAVPASSWISVGAVWAASTVGLVNEDDEAMPPVDQVVTVARFFAFDQLSRYAPNDPDRAAFSIDRDRAAIVARQLMFFQQPTVNGSTHTVLRTGTSGTYARRSWP